MATELNIIRVALFECYETEKEKEKINVADLIGKRIFNLEKEKGKYQDLKSTLEFNIKRKLTARESEDLSKSKYVESSVSEIFGMGKIGRPLTSLTLALSEDGKDSFNNLLDSEDDNSFRKLSADFANKYVKYKKKVKGIIGFIQFYLKTNVREEKFLSIITTDFSKGVLSSDPSTAIKFLEKAFDQNFKNIILYPYLKSITRRTIETENSQVKVHQRTADPDLFIVSNIESPLDPQKIFEELYKRMRGQTRNLSEILEQLEEDFPDKVKVLIKFKDYSVKVRLKDFLEDFKLINETSKGQGIFIKNAIVDVEIAGKNLFGDGYLRYKSLNEISEELNQEENPDE